MTFPGPGAVIEYNEAGEPTGWDYPNDDADSYYCDMCGCNHQGSCPDDYDDEDYEEDASCQCGHPDCGAC